MLRRVNNMETAMQEHVEFLKATLGKLSEGTIVYDITQTILNSAKLRLIKEKEQIVKAHIDGQEFGQMYVLSNAESEEYFNSKFNKQS